MALATVAGLSCAGLVAWALGGDSRTAGFAVLALLVGSVLTFAPALLRVSVEHWGVAVLLAGVARALAVLGIAYALDHSGAGLLTRPLFFGSIGGAVLVLAAESAVAIRMLAHLDRARTALKHPPTA